jgi:hypothetical protein
MPRELNIIPKPKPACEMCGGIGIVDKGSGLAPCSCPLGKTPASIWACQPQQPAAAPRLAIVRPPATPVRQKEPLLTPEERASIDAFAAKLEARALRTAEEKRTRLTKRAASRARREVVEVAHGRD